MKYQVIRDFGVVIAGKIFAHGSIIDTDKMTPELSPDASILDEAERAAALQKRQDAATKQAQDDFAAAEKAGFVEPAVDAPEPRRAKKGQE